VISSSDDGGELGDPNRDGSVSGDGRWSFFRWVSRRGFTGDMGQGRYSSLPHHEDRFGGYSSNPASGLPCVDFGKG